MNYTAVFTLAIAVLLIIYYGNIYLSRFKLIGDPNPSNQDDSDKANWQLYYFHTPHCGQCKNITPWVSELNDAHPNIQNIDISQHIELAQKFNVRATPTAVFLEENIIVDVQLGATIVEPIKAFIEKHGTAN